MADLKTNMANAWESTLSSALASGATTLNVTDTTGSPAVPFYVVLDPGNDAKREVVLVDSAKTATTFTLTAASKRGQDGTSDVAHDSGAVVAIVPVAAWFTDLHDRIDADATAVAAKADDSAVVHLAGAETITGAKTFSTDPTLADGSSALSLTEGNAAYATAGHAHATPAARVYRLAGLSVADSTVVAIGMDVEDFDTDGWHDTVTNNSRVTVAETTRYRISGAIDYGAHGTGTRHVRIHVNGSVKAYSEQPVNSAGSRTLLMATTTVALTAGDYVELCAFQTSGTSLALTTGAAQTHLSVERI